MVVDDPGGRQLGEGRAGERSRLAILERAKAGRKSRLAGKAGEQGLAKGVDRLDTQAAWCIEHAREQGAGEGHRFGTVIFAQRLQIGGEVGVRTAYPAGQALVDAIGHLGRARLGEGEAEDRRGGDAAQQQPQHAGGKDMRLARSRRRRQPHLRARIGCAPLLAEQRLEGGQAAHRAFREVRLLPSLKGRGEDGRSRPYHSSRRISWS